MSELNEIFMGDTLDYTWENLQEVTTHAWRKLRYGEATLLPDEATRKRSESTLLDKLPVQGHDIYETTDHLLQDIAPALSGSSLLPHYYGFVTGGVTPAARVGEVITSLYDQNVGVHLPDQSIATIVEDRALKMLLDLFRLDRNQWSGQFTTGATSSNIVGLALGREYIINRAIERVAGETNESNTVGASGLLRACRLAGVEDVLVITTRPHSSLGKAASVIGLGRDSVVDVGGGNHGLSFDLQKLEGLMLERSKNNAFIVAVSCSEVNTGLFATDGLEAMQNLRTLCDRYGAWLHMDGAFGIFARLLDGEPNFERVAKGAAGIELADSITGDAHKLLNVPYDCGFLFCRSGTGLSEKVFQNANAPYLKGDRSSANVIQSPLNIGLENSRRFRGLPVYTTLMAYGSDGYKQMLTRQVRLARAIANFIFHHQELQLLPASPEISEDTIEQNTFIIVLFRAKNDKLNDSLVERINATRDIYCSQTSWDGHPATRIAISNFDAREDDLSRIQRTLKKVLDSWEAELAVPNGTVPL